MNNFHILIELSFELKELLKKEQLVKTQYTKKKEIALVEKMDEWFKENFKNPGINSDEFKHYFER